MTYILVKAHFSLDTNLAFVDAIWEFNRKSCQESRFPPVIARLWTLSPLTDHRITDGLAACVYNLAAITTTNRLDFT